MRKKTASEKKKASPQDIVILGLRSTREQRVDMNFKAAEMGLSLQAYFEDSMTRAEQRPPWLAEGKELIPADTGNRELHALLDEALATPVPWTRRLIADILQSFKALEQQRVEQHNETSFYFKGPDRDCTKPTSTVAKEATEAGGFHPKGTKLPAHAVESPET